MGLSNDELTDSEIRLIILSAYYNSLKTGKKFFEAKIPRLEHLDYQIINWHFIWLIEHDLLKGGIEETNAGSIAFVTRISRKGIDFIEELSGKEASESNSQLYSQIKETSTTEEKSVKFSELVLEGMKLGNNIMTLINRFLGG